MKRKISYNNGGHVCTGFPIEQFHDFHGENLAVSAKDFDDVEGEINDLRTLLRDAEKANLAHETMEIELQDKIEKLQNELAEEKDEFENLQEQRNELRDRVQVLENELDAIKTKAA